MCCVFVGLIAVWGLDIALVLLTFVERMAAGASMARSLPSIRLLRPAVSAVAVWMLAFWMLGQSHCPHRIHGAEVLGDFRSLVANSFVVWFVARLLRLIRAFKRMHKSKELVVLLSGTGKAARRGQRVDLAVDVCWYLPRSTKIFPSASSGNRLDAVFWFLSPRFLRQSLENKCQQNRFLVGKGIDR